VNINATEMPERPDDIVSSEEKSTFLMYFNFMLGFLASIRSDIDDDAVVTDFSFGEWQDPNIQLTLGLLDENLEIGTDNYHTVYISKYWAYNDYNKIFGDTYEI
jgi:hypothetical protein